MDSDPISEATPKRRKLNDGNTYTDLPSSYTLAGSDDDEEIATVPLSHPHRYQKPVARHFGHAGPTQSRPLASQSGGLFASTMATINAGPYETQPTQLLSQRPDIPSSPSDRVEVLASSPMRAPLARATPLTSSMAPPGTTFRRPGQSEPHPTTRPQSQSQSQRPASQSIDLTFVDPPVELLSSSDDEGQEIKQDIRPTDFQKFLHNADDMSSAYGGGRPRPQRPPQKQSGPARAKAVDVSMTLDDILDFTHRKTVAEMREILPNESIAKLYSVLRQNRDHKYDALNAFQEMDEYRDMPSASDDELAIVEPTQPRTTKQNIGVQQSIRERAQQRSERTLLPKTQINRTVQQPEPVTPPKPKRRLVKGRKDRTPEASSDRAVVDISSDSEASDPQSEVDAIETASETRLLKFLNTCSTLELADLANEQADTAKLIVSQRPFKSLNVIRMITDTRTVPKGKRAAKKTIGDRVLDVCLEMWDGYEAVDKLVEQCKELGKPILDIMKKWGADVDAVSKQGELELANLDSPNDSGIGTPASSVIADDDIVGPKAKKAALLKQPENMASNLVMKDYQVIGLNWLNLLWTKRLSCILADDMGLGKTCQVISFFAHLKQTGQSGPHLVIVPGSTLENWSREFQNFCPDIRVDLYYGSMAERAELRAELEDTRDEVDVVVTTYDTAVARDDNKFLRRILKPRVCVFDEGHMLKNAAAKRHKELMQIPSEFRLLLTGTPLQNNLQELASLLGFILPELFESSKEDLSNVFKYRASTKDSSHSALLSTQRIERARSMMAPFILRRRKAVLGFLPPKVRRVEYCEMVPAQKALWDSLVAQAQVDRLQKGTVPARRKANGTTGTVHMTSLRFAALHPLLLREVYDDHRVERLQNILMKHARSEFRGNPPELVRKYLTSDLKGGDFRLHQFCFDRSDYIPAAQFTLQNEEWMSLSGKIPVLRRLLEEWIPAGSRVLIFSQFTSLLDVLEAVLGTLSIRFCRIDGSTKMDERQPLIDEFYNDKGIGVFMLTTGAGGAGINLAAADKVVIMEGGFNPQDEIQAENRAHRVGQTRPVEVVRLVTKGTIEELILKLGESKLALDERVHASAEGGGDGVDNEGLGARENSVGAAVGDGGGESKIEEMFFADLDTASTEPKSALAQAEAALQDAEKRKAKLYPSLEAEVNSAPASESAMVIVEDDSLSEQSTPVKKDGKKPKASVKGEDSSLGGTGGRLPRRGATQRQIKDESEDEPEEAEAKPRKRAAKAKQSQGADIGDMFRRGMRKRGVDVG